MAPGPLRIDLPATGLALRTEVRHASATGWHCFGPVLLVRADGTTVGPADPVLAVALITAAADRRARRPATTAAHPRGS